MAGGVGRHFSTTTTFSKHFEMRTQMMTFNFRSQRDRTDVPVIYNAKFSHDKWLRALTTSATRSYAKNYATRITAE